MKLLHFLGSLSVIISATSLITYINLTWLGQYYWVQLTSPTPTNGTEYDFIIVGSGSAGSAVVGRLGEAGYKVLLLEAGGPSHWLQGIPGYPGFFMRGPYSWNTVTPPMDHAKAHVDHRIGQTRGKVLGGGSMLNWMAYMRGHSEDYDEWEQMGNPGWGFKDVIKYFKMSEKFQGDYLDEDMDKFHSKEGKVGVQYTAHHYPFNSMMDDLFKELGIPLGDVNGKLEDKGFFKSGHAQVTLSNSWRVGTYQSYVEPLLATAEIEVLTFSHATKVLFEGTKAVGVEYERFGQRHYAYASKEVIVSAGAIGSPQLLMLSGIGPKKHLKEHGIHLLKDLPVGENLHDHVLTYIPFSTNTSMLTKGPLEFMNPWYFLQAILFQKGPLMDTLLGTNGFIHTKLNKDKNRPDMQIHTMPCLLNYDWGAGFKDAFFYDPDMFGRIYEDQMDTYGVIFTPTLARPKSRGTLKLTSSNPLEEPIYDPKYFSHPDDAQVLVETAKYILSWANTDTFKKYDLKPMQPKSEPCPEEPFSDEFLKCHVMSWANTVFHPVGTCKMGPDSDPKAVVDAQLRVKGLKSLRVIDASIMPTIVGANTNAPSIMIGERGVDFVLEHWKKSTPSTQKQAKRDEL